MTANAPSIPVRVPLPAVMNIASVGSLTRDLLALRGQPIRLDGSQVERLGALGLQLLLSARLTWQADNLGFAVVDPSDALRTDWALFGAPAFDDFNRAVSS